MQVISALVLGGPSTKAGSSAKFCVVVCKSSLLWYCGESISQSRLICQVLCSDMQVISALVLEELSAEEGSSAKFGVAVFKASILNYPGGPLAEVGLSAKFGVAVFQTSMLNSWGFHLPKYVHLPSFVYWYSRQISPVRVEISYCHLEGVSGSLGC